AVGRGDAPSGIDVGGIPGADEPPDVARLRATAQTIPGAPLLRVLESGIAVDGPPVLAAAVARSLAVRIAARRSPAATTCEYPPGEEWADHLPHDTRPGAPGRYRFADADSERFVC